jgi:hypothetical protein
MSRRSSPSFAIGGVVRPSGRFLVGEISCAFVVCPADPAVMDAIARASTKDVCIIVREDARRDGRDRRRPLP